ncbi:MAG: efflux RND transporter permease subunit [Acidobacteria bacterium]|nr:efflux RND transporter permease subunit [Acidobacteriota bacterium]MBU1473712.1 efflux RND transporter permease subunit [Acidobacteriota bacterium]
MKIVKFSINRPVTIVMFTMAAVIFGVISYSRLKLNLLPTISYPTLTIKTEYPGTAPSEIENIVSKPIEETCGVVDNVVRISSISRAELSEVMVEFAWDTNMDFATLKIREKLDLIRLPVGAAKPVILRYDPNQEPIMKLGLTGEGNDLSWIRYIAEREVKQALESIEGVASCSISGGLEDEIHIDIDEQQLSLLNIPITTVANRLVQENVNLSAGILKQKDSQFLVRTVNQFKTVEEIKDIIVEKRGDVQITLGSIADVFRGYKERKVISRINGNECIEAAIYRAADANTVSVANAVTEKLETVRRTILQPRNMDFLVITNQSKFIRSTIDQVKQTALIGGLLAIFVLLYFLKNFRSTLIIGMAIPISVIITFFLMYSSDISLNIISMGGLALGIGMLVDNSIVVLESIQRYREQGKNLYDAALEGTSEVAGAVTASTFTTVAVFFPIVFVEGVAGQLFKDMALTVTFSLLASLVVSLTLVPMLNSAMRRESKGPSTSRMLTFIFKPLDAVYERFFSSYKKAQAASFSKRRIILVMVVLLFFGSVFMIRFMGQELIPVISQGEFMINVEFKPGTALKENASIISDIRNKLKEYKEVESIYELIGKGSRGGISFQEERENLSEFVIRLEDGILGKKEDRIMDRVRADLEQFSTAKIKIYKPRLFSFKAPLEVVISANNVDMIKQVSDEMLEKMRGIEGIIDLKSSMEEGYPEIQIIFNRAILASQDMTINSVGSQIRNKIEGDVATRFIESDREVDIRVRISENFRDRVEKIERLTIRNGLGVIVPLKALAEIRISEGPAEIRRILQQKSAVITGNLSGLSLKDASTRILEVKESLDIPPECSVNLAGQSMEQNVAFSSMVFAILLAIFLVYLVMASQFESFKKPFIIMFTIPLGLIGVVIVGLVFSMSVNVIVLIGLVILSGIIVNNAIVLVDYIGRLQEKGMAKLEAIKTAARVRWRPILMTTITTVLGLFPMAIDFNEGFEIRIPLALTLIGGLIFGTFLTLIFIPLVYNWVVKETKPGEASGRLTDILKKTKKSLSGEKAKTSES